MSENKQPIFEVSLDEVLHNSMMPYAEHVILDRALPRVEDGLKPVQRRILYTMYELGLTPDKPHKKCAKIVGDCLGKYHPHGDSSVYDALVRMAQDFNMRMPLVNGHGNFGTVDGDTAAAYRYTEARLEQLALELLRDIDKDTVDFSLNFDDSLMEPNTLPGRFPNLLVNGATGIAVGLATNIPPHNLGEVIDGTIAMIDNPKISLKEMMKHIKGPDFPTGAQIVGGEELENAYATGRGKIRIRANISLETDGAKRSIVIKEIPYQVNKANLLKKIADLKEDKKEEAFADIAEVVDESDRTGMRAVVRLKKDADANKICALLLKYTDLETTFGINMVAIAGGKPKQMGLLEILSYYINYQREVILRRSKYDLERAKERAHILEGLIIAVLNIDEVVRIIKNSANTPEARQNLRARFQLSEIQANAVLDLRLARLTRLEITKLQEELEQLRRLIKELTAIIGSKKLQMEVVKTELTEIKKKYKNARRTGIGGAAEVAIEETAAEEKAVRNLVAVFTADRTFKLVPEKNYNLSDRSVEGGGAGDILTLSVPVRSDQMLLAFSNLGNAFKIDPEIVQAAKLRDKGQKFTDVAKDAQQNEYPVAFYPLEEELPLGNLLFLTRQGMIKKTNWSEYSLLKNYYQAIKLKEDDELITVVPELFDMTLAFVTERGMCLNALMDDIPVQGRVAGGVKGINLAEGDSAVMIKQVDDAGEIIVITSAGTYKRVLVSDFEPMARYRKGVKIVDLGEKDKVIFADFVQDPYDVAVVDRDGVAFVVNSEDISIDNRVTKGKTLRGENKKRMPEKAFRVIQ